LTPAHFFRPHENPDLAQEVDLWVIDRAIELLAKYPNYRFNINLTHYVLELSNLQEVINDKLTGTDATHRLFFELNEYDRHFRKQELVTLFDLTKIGGLVIDDVGEASLTQMFDLPIAGIKIDGKVVERVVKDDGFRSFVWALFWLARKQRWTCTCEYVSSPEIWQALKEIAHPLHYSDLSVQGWTVGMPAPLSSLSD
jgi:EAL domain-containing protein (putative c-di-GMP-specific phosphodiesterase class I)